MIGLPGTASTRVMLAFASALLGGAASAGAQTIATLDASSGQVTVLRLGQAQALSPSMPLQLNDILVTRQGRASVRFHSDGTVLRVGPESRVQIDESATEREIKLFFGRIWAHVIRWKERPTRFSSGSTIAAIRGTELSLAVASDGNETQLSVLEGRVEAETDAGKLNLEGGQVATAAKGRAPAVTLNARPLDAVQWALYYPPVLYTKPGAPEGPSQRASAKLAAGSVEDAGKDLDEALKQNANDVNALSLRTIVSVATNRPDEALASAQKAVAADPKSATAQVAMSYAQQAKFDLEGARTSLERAVELEPTNALAWARLAEIRSSLGHLDAALEAARKGTELAPNLSRTQTVLGFAYLAEVKTAEARAALGRAIGLDGSDPLPRLGLGLARIREGELAEGSKEIELAVSLDPGQSLLRSYLGKAYFEAKRESLVGREYELAKQADPKDPTPWLYDAIAKQTTNQPVEALHDNQQAIELNDNRAVYRSRLLLDSDLAARSASLGRLYSDLGFQNLALVEGWKSVNTDPTSNSAHRLLADSYAALPRHEIARVSELLQSQLLQPLNTTPIQPRLAESNLFLTSGGGPASLAFNEFNPLFNRNGVNLQASGLLGQDGLWSGEGILAGIYNKLSFSLGYNQFSMDGWRANAYQDDKIANAFLQLELSPSTSVQAEYRYRNRDHGDLQQRFYADAFLPGLSDAKKTNGFRLGGRHSLSPRSTLLVSLSYQDADAHVRNEDLELPDTFIDSVSPITAKGAELQHLFRSRRFNLTSGVGYFKIDGEIRSQISLFGDVLDLPVEETNFDHFNVYTYANLNPIPTVTLTAGASLDHLSGTLPGGDGQQFNPKFGLTWNPHPNTTLRGSVARTQKRTLITDQTLEPTQVAGFNQFYDDFNQTEAWRYGGALDQKLGKDAYAGVELSKRDLTVPIIDLESVTQERPWDELLARAYVFGTPHRFLALRAQYIYERFQHEPMEGFDPLTFGFTELKTHRVPLGVGFFHRSGISASATATYWKQDGQLEDLNAFPTEFRAASSTFWLVDAALNLRLPKRYGFISIGATNLFDKDFEYFEVDFDNPTIQPKRSFFAKVTLAVP